MATTDDERTYFTEEEFWDAVIVGYMDTLSPFRGFEATRAALAKIGQMGLKLFKRLRANDKLEIHFLIANNAYGECGIGEIRQRIAWMATLGSIYHWTDNLIELRGGTVQDFAAVHYHLPFPRDDWLAWVREANAELEAERLAHPLG